MIRKWGWLVLVALCFCFGTAFAKEQEIYDWEWYQTPQPNEQGKAYVEFGYVGEVPVKLTPTPDWDVATHKWVVQFEYHETNGIDFLVERFTQVFFGEDHQPHAVFAFEGREQCAQVLNDAMIRANENGIYGTNRPVADEIGYGVAISGTDANGHARTFGFYIPLSHEEGSIHTPESLLEVPTQLPDQAFLRLIPVEDPAPLLVASENFDGGNGWFYGTTILNVSDIAFTPTQLQEIVFVMDGTTGSSVFSQEQMVEWGAPEVYEQGTNWEMSGGMPQQDVLGIGYILTGIDANGNELEFSTYLDLAQE